MDTENISIQVFWLFFLFFFFLNLASKMLAVLHWWNHKVLKLCCTAAAKHNNGVWCTVVQLEMAKGQTRKKKNQCYICRYSHNCKMHANSSFAIHFNISVFQIKYFNDNLDILFLLRNQHLSILPGSMLCIHILAKNCNVNTFLLFVSLQKYKIRYPLGWRRSQSTIHLMLHFIILHFFSPN